MKRASRKPILIGASQIVSGDAVYNVELHVDVTAALRQLGPKAAGSRAGRAQTLNGAVVVTAKQANVSGGES